MSEVKEIRLGSRYGDTHKLIPVDGYENVYRFKPAQDWMPIYCAYDGHWNDDDEEKELVNLDSDGGPFLTVGMTINGMTITRLFYKKDVGYLVQF